MDTTQSYYAVPVTAGTTYTIFLSSMTDDADLYIYNADSTFTTWGCRPYLGDYTDEICSVTASETTMYIMVDGTYTSFGALYTLEVN